MKEKGLKYVFFSGSFILLILMLAMSRNAAVSCDEVLHYDQSVSVYNWFASGGRDQSALNTPVTHLKYYGQSYDNLVTIIAEWLNIDNIYTFRHFMSAFAGWLAVFVAALFAAWLSGTGTGIITIFLFAVSPTFIGHSLNNLKDIPFALGYLISVFYTLKIFFSEGRVKPGDVVLLVLGTGIAISIRAGGLLLVCYLFLFLIISSVYRYREEGRFNLNENVRKLILAVSVSGASFLLGILLWPFALQHPFRNVPESLRMMAHFPDTFRQIFEGRAEWSDFMPWYYLPKSMMITMPVIVMAGAAIFLLFPKKVISTGKALCFTLVIFTAIFPLSYAIISRSNLYSSWRQFLFVYPLIVIIAAAGFSFLIEHLKKRYLKLLLLLAMALIAVHPVRFMSRNPVYSYMYYNQLVGGLKGAFGNYETDYYYAGQSEASEWLIKYLKEKGETDGIKVGATYSVQWQFRKEPEIRTFYMRNEERSCYDWDYAIITNRYISPYMLKNGKWPPENAIHTVYADSVPICAVLERKSKSDFYGYEALREGRTADATGFYSEALKENNTDEMIFFNFAGALLKNGQTEITDSLLKEGLKLNPDSEMILMFLGNIAADMGRREEAINFYERVLKADRKYFEAYVKLSALIERSDRVRARSLLRECLRIDPGYKPAIIALADTYRSSDPEVARKYDELANKIK
jgi:tetratricopeptide (TPR) repeat protein